MILVRPSHVFVGYSLFKLGLPDGCGAPQTSRGMPNSISDAVPLHPRIPETQGGKIVPKCKPGNQNVTVYITLWFWLWLSYVPKVVAVTGCDVCGLEDITSQPLFYQSTPPSTAYSEKRLPTLEIFISIFSTITSFANILNNMLIIIYHKLFSELVLFRNMIFSLKIIITKII